MSVLRTILGVGSVAVAGSSFIVLGLLLLALKISIICGVVYFFLALAGFVPAVDVVPFIPYI